MNIRYAEEKDMLQIIALCKAHAVFEQSDYKSRHKLELLSKYLFAEKPILKCLVVEKNNVLVGYATFMKQFSTWDASFYIYLDCLFLNEQTRGQGIGKLIMKKIKEYGKLENCKEIQWQTPYFNKKAIEFYTKIGATSKNKERFFWNT